MAKKIIVFKRLLLGIIFSIAGIFTGCGGHHYWQTGGVMIPLNEGDAADSKCKDIGQLPGEMVPGYDVKTADTKSGNNISLPEKTNPETELNAASFTNHYEFTTVGIMIPVDEVKASDSKSQKEEQRLPGLF